MFIVRHSYWFYQYHITNDNKFCTLLLRAMRAVFCVAKWYGIRLKPDKSTDVGCHSSPASGTWDNFGNFPHGKTGWRKSRGMIKPLPFWKRGHGMGVFLHVEQALRRKVVLKLVWFTTQGFYFVVENLIFPRPFLLGISLKSALYWEIGMKSTALKRIKAFVSKTYFFFFFFFLEL